MPNAEYTRWKKILLDTNTVIDLIKGRRAGCTPHEAFVAKLISDLSKPARKAQFFISFITLAELQRRVNNIDKMREIVIAISGNNVTFSSFGTGASEYMSLNYTQFFGRRAMNDLIQRANWEGDNLVDAREWINRDLMLMASAQSLGVDVILSRDVRTFYPVSKEVEAFCAMTYEECYEITPNYIHNYLPESAEIVYERMIPAQQRRRLEALSGTAEIHTSQNGVS
jgi:predicted nucleic acid-binding protein